MIMLNPVYQFLQNKLHSPLDIPTPQIADLPMGKMQFAIYGEGIPLLFLHGGVGGYDQSILLFKRYIPQGYKMICPSRPGYLGTPLETGQSKEAQADALAALLDYLQINSIIITGISAGGLSLYTFASRHPERVKAIIAIDAIAGEYLIPEQTGKIAQNMFLTDFSLWFTKESLVYFPETVIKNLIRAEGYLDQQKIDQRVKEIVESQEQLEVIAELIYSMSDYAPRQLGTINDMKEGANAKWDNFAKIECPALIIHGTHDADVKFYHGVFAYEQLKSKKKSKIWLEYGTHYCFFFAKEATSAQEKFREFIIEYS